MLTFDEKGHLTPYEIIGLSFPELEKIFAGDLEDRGHRERLFQNYLNFTNDLLSRLKGDFHQYVDGSFTTTKPKPGDIDLVTFLDLKLFSRNQSTVIWFLQNAKRFYGIDCFFVPYCKPFDPFYPSYLDALNYWTNLFGYSREDANGARHPKGIIKVSFNYDDYKRSGILQNQSPGA